MISSKPLWVLRSFVATAAFALVVFCIASPSAQAQTWQELIGYDDLVTEKGAVEDGTGIGLSMTEADVDAGATFQYLPDASNAGLAGKTIVDASGNNNNGSSGHATGMARNIFGDVSISQGESSILVYDANDYINNVLGYATGFAPDVQTSKVQNHSWIGNFANNAGGISAAEDVLKRLDFVINRDQMSIVVGVNNGSTSATPMLLGQSYNAISVGLLNGNHSQGNSTLYGAGRVMPSVVMEATNTSTATARTSSVMAVLHHKAVVQGNADASRPEVMKSILMAGATKVAGWSRTNSRPLDNIYGAGLVNIQNSYHILEGGEVDGQITVPAAATMANHGYDYGESITAAQPLYYAFEIGTDEQAVDLSLLVTWNMDVVDGDPGFSFSPVADPVTDLANLSLTLYDSTNSPLDFILDFSDSSVDNVEHIFMQTLGTGSYTVEIRSDQDTDFGFAWNYHTFATSAVPEPNSLLFLLGVSGIVGMARRRRN